MTDRLLSASFKSAGLLNYENVCIDAGKCRHLVSCQPVMHYEDPTECWQSFSIANPADRDAVVQMLLNRRVPIIKKYGLFGYDLLTNAGNRLGGGSGYETYIDAVIAAVLAL